MVDPVATGYTEAADHHQVVRAVQVHETHYLEFTRRALPKSGRKE